MLPSRRYLPSLGPTTHHVSRDHAIIDNPALPINVFQKEIQSFDALSQPCLDMPPLGSLHHPWQTVDRNDLLFGLVVSIDRKSDSLIREREHDPLLDAAEILRGEMRQSLIELLTMLSRRAVRQEHLVVDGRVKIVVMEIHRSTFPRGIHVLPSHRNPLEHAVSQLTRISEADLGQVRVWGYHKITD